MKSSQFLGENFVEDAHSVHQDHEVQMAREELYHSAEYALRLHKLLRNVDEQQGLEGWVSSKITLASDYLKTVLEYMEYELMTAANQQTMLPIAENMQQGVAEGSFDYAKRGKELDASTKKIQANADRRIRGKELDASIKNIQTNLDKRIKKTDKGMAEGEYKSRHIHRQEQNKKYDEYRRNQEAQGKKPLSRGDWAATQRKGQQGVAEGSEDLASLRAKAKEISDKIDAIVKDGGRVGFNDPLSRQLKAIRAKIQQAKKQGVAEDMSRRVAIGPDGQVTGGYQPSTSGEPVATQPKSPEEIEFDKKQADWQKQKQENLYQQKLNNYMRGDNRGAGFGFQPRPEDIEKANAARSKLGINEMSAGSVATVVNPTPKNKAKTGTLFGGTYKQPKAKK